MQPEELKLELIQWIIDIRDPELLERLLKQKKEEQRAKEEKFFSLFGSWQSEENGDELIEEIYGSRMDKPRNIEL